MPTDLPLPPSPAQKAWAQYVQLEHDRIRRESQDALTQVIHLVTQLNESEWHPWARAVAMRAVDSDCDFPVRIPLFRQVLFPALLSGLANKEPGCARWLAGFHQMLHKSPECQSQLQDVEPGEVALLEKALEHDPSDALARGRLIRELNWWLEYTLHELPSGVLFASHFASIEECAELERDLATLEKLAVDHDVHSEHSELIAECGFHFKAYAKFLRNRDHYSSYDQYLQQTGTA